MCLHGHSDASFLSVVWDRSRAGGHFFFGDKPKAGLSPAQTIINGAIHVVCQIMKNVMGSAAEAEIGAGYINARELLPICTAAIEIGHPQPHTALQVDNSTAVGFASKIIKQKMSKAIDMCFYWLQDRKDQGQFKTYWSPGRNNLGDYHSKHHPTPHHKVMRPSILHSPHFLNCLTQCLMARVC
jgi:hypothetical protein